MVLICNCAAEAAAAWRKLQIMKSRPEIADQRPPFAIEPGPAQESVWDYPRPPAIQWDARPIEVRDGGALIAATAGGYKVMETASPPTFYLPPEDVRAELLTPIAGSSICEWKGRAGYFALARDPSEPIAWAYSRPRPRFAKIRNYFAFYPGRIACFVDGERVEPQPGRFYGGWITSDVVGPFKGEPGTESW